MKWLFGQVWLYCLIAFLLGVLLTWLIMRFLRRPHVEVSETPSAAREPEPRAATPAASAVAAPVVAAVFTVDAAPPEPKPGAAAAEPVPEPDAEPEPAAPLALAEAEVTEVAAATELDEPEGLDEVELELDEPELDEPDGPYGRGSALPSDGGAAPGDDFTVKGNADSMLFHTLASPYYGRTIAEVWFRAESDARRAGFTAWNERSKAKVKAADWEAGPYPGSALPREDGSSPADEFTVKGNADSMLFHTTTSPYYTRIKAEVWFRNAEDAEQAGFTAWNRPRQRT
jgi:hypothetical protein